ncbi:MAG: aspartate aminotransferase family protein [Promethearchaeota archaeon]
MEKNVTKSFDVIDRDEKVIGSAIHIRFYPLSIESGKGVYLYDSDGNEYLDFNAGAAVAICGYGHPKIVKAVQDQVEKLSHHCFTLHSNPVVVELAEKLIQITPGDWAKKIWFGLSGSDANETIYKLVPYATKRRRIMSFMAAYHGQTMGAYTLSGHTAQTEIVGLPNVVKVPYAYCYRCPFGKDLECPECGLQCVDFIEKQVMTTICPPRDTSCILVEPIQSDGGDIPPPPEFLKGLKELCEKYGILFAVDEVKHGFGRTGKMFGIECFDIEPDIITMAKPMANGMPLSACVAPTEILDSLVAGHLLTTGGHPVSAAASLATLEVIKEENLAKNAAEMGDYLIKRLSEIQQERTLIGDVRGKGLIIGVELVRDQKTKEPASLECAKVMYRAWELGLILIYVGVHSNTIEITPPLIINKEHCDKAIDIINQSIKDVEEGKISDEKIARFAGW